MHDDLPHAMRETARRLEPDVVRLAAGGISRGTRMRRIERVVQVLGSMVAVAVVFAGVALFGPHRTTGAGSGGDVNQPAGSGDASTSATVSPSAQNAVTLPSAPSSTEVPQVSGGQLISTLKSCIGATGIAGRAYVPHGSDFAWDTNVAPPSAISVAAQLTAANQVGSIAIVAYGRQAHVALPSKPRVLRDRSVVYVTQQKGSSDGRHADRIDLSVTLVRTDGASLVALETNAPTPKGAAAPGAPLLLSADQVTSMLDSSVWDAAVAAADALPSSDRANAPVSSDAPDPNFAVR